MNFILDNAVIRNFSVYLNLAGVKTCTNSAVRFQRFWTESKLADYRAEIVMVGNNNVDSREG